MHSLLDDYFDKIRLLLQSDIGADFYPNPTLLIWTPSLSHFHNTYGGGFVVVLSMHKLTITTAVSVCFFYHYRSSYHRFTTVTITVSLTTVSAVMLLHKDGFVVVELPSHLLFDGCSRTEAAIVQHECNECIVSYSSEWCTFTQQSHRSQWRVCYVCQHMPH